MLKVPFAGNQSGTGRTDARRVDSFEALAGRVRFGARRKLGAELVGRALQFTLVYIAQRTLGPATYGQFTYALAVGFVLAPLTDFGIQLTVTQQLARDELDAAAVTGAGLTMKAMLALVVSIVLVAASQTRPPGMRVATFGLGLAMVLGSFTEFFGYAFRGLQRVEYDAALTLLTRGLTVALGIWALQRGLGIGGLAVAYLVGSGSGAAVGYFWLRTRFFAPRFTLAVGRWGSLSRQALPLGGALLLSIAYTRTAVFLLDIHHGPEAVGMYGVAQRLTEPLSVIPAALMAAVFPAFVQVRAGGGIETRQLRVRTITSLAALGALVAGAGVLGGPWLITLLYGEQYGGSVAPLQILALAVLLTFVNYAMTHFIIAQDLQRRYLLFTAIVFLLNLVLCLALIPRFGPAGAAGAVLTSEMVLLALCWRAVPSEPRPWVRPFETDVPRLE